MFRRHSTARISAILLWLVLLGALHAQGRWAEGAEEAKPARIYMKNGDLITGRIVGVESQSIVVETKHLGKVWVAREGIERFEPPLPSRLILKSGEEMKGEVVDVSKDSVTLRQGEVTQEITNQFLWRLEVQGEEAPLLTGSFSAGLSLNDGNSDSFGYNLRGSLIRETYWNEFRLRGGYIFEELEGVATNDRADALLHVSHFFDRPWYTYFRERLEADRITDISLRSETGVGLGYRLIDEGDTRLDLEAGPGYQFTRFQGGGKDDLITARVGTAFRTSFPGGVKLEASADYNQGLETAEDFIARAEVTLKFPLRNNLSFNFSVLDRYDNTPAPGSERNDLTILSNMEFTF